MPVSRIRKQARLKARREWQAIAKKGAVSHEGDNEPTLVGDDVVKDCIGWKYGDASYRYSDIDSDIGDALDDDEVTE